MALGAPRKLLYDVIIYHFCPVPCPQILYPLDVLMRLGSGLCHDTRPGKKLRNSCLWLISHVPVNGFLSLYNTKRYSAFGACRLRM